MTNDLAKTIAAACLEAIQSRPDTPTVDELREVVIKATAEVATEKLGVEVQPDLRPSEELPWDKLRDPITDGPEYASTQELYDARPFINAEVPFQLINGRRCITEEQVVKDEDIANFVSRHLRFFEHDLITGAYFFRERTLKTPEAGNGE